jgi:hypothetical protein
MDSISNLYDEVMAGAIEKTAAETEGQDVAFDADFFEKVAAGEDEALGELSAFVEAAQAEGASDEQIEEALGEAMQAAGYDEGAEGEDAEDDEGEDEFENAKLSAYVQGSEQAIVDALESEMAKEAGVTFDDLVEYELGGHFGTGYAETRQEADEAIEKIAAKKGKAAKGAKALLDKIRGAGSRYGELMAGGKGKPGMRSAFDRVAKGSPAAKTRTEARKVIGARLGTGAAVGAAGAGGYRMARGKKD